MKRVLSAWGHHATQSMDSTPTHCRLLATGALLCTCPMPSGLQGPARKRTGWGGGSLSTPHRVQWYRSMALPVRAPVPPRGLSHHTCASGVQQTPRRHVRGTGWRSCGDGPPLEALTDLLHHHRVVHGDVHGQGAPGVEGGKLPRETEDGGEPHASGPTPGRRCGRRGCHGSCLGASLPDQAGTRVGIRTRARSPALPWTLRQARPQLIPQDPQQLTDGTAGSHHGSEQLCPAVRSLKKSRCTRKQDGRAPEGTPGTGWEGGAPLVRADLLEGRPEQLPPCPCGAAQAPWPPTSSCPRARTIPSAGTQSSPWRG